MLAEWHLPPDHIVNNWTDELLNLMITKLVERKNRESEAISSRGSGVVSGDTDRVVSDKELFAQLGNKLKVVKRGD